MITLLVSLEKQEDEQVDTVVEIKKSGTVLEAIIEVFCSSFFMSLFLTLNLTINCDLNHQLLTLK
jgi:hypothetical protein